MQNRVKESNYLACRFAQVIIKKAINSEPQKTTPSYFVCSLGGIAKCQSTEADYSKI